MSEKIRRRITAVILALAMVIGLMPAVTPTAYADATHNISLVTAASYIFDPATEGYSTQPFYSVRVQNTGTAATGALNIALSGTNPDAFTLSATSVSDIAVSYEAIFNVKYNTGLAAGTYTAVVTVSGDNVDSKSFDVSFTVVPAGTTYPAQIRTYIDDALADMTGDVELHAGSSVIPMQNTGTGIYEKAVPTGNYFIYINSVSTGRMLIVKDLNYSTTLSYFTVSFSATKAGDAAGSSVSASVDSVAIHSGDKVLSGKTVAITASGTGAGRYTYAWSGAGTSGETTATLSITVSNTVNAACVVTGSGAPLSSPDYEINGAGYNWTGSDQIVVLSGTNDTLTIHKAPAAAVRIEVQSPDGAEVNIRGDANGGSVMLRNTEIVVTNNITLKLADLDITAPPLIEDSALLLMGEGDLTVDIGGTCSLNGSGLGSGIRAEHAKHLVITGSNGILNAAGGNANSTEGGAGIVVSNFGALLTIRGDITINATGGNSATFSGGSGIKAVGGDLEISGGVVHATSGESQSLVDNSSFGIMASYPASAPNLGGNITVTGGTVIATGGNANSVSGGYGIYAFNKLRIEGGSVTAIGGDSVSGTGGSGALAYKKNLEISGGSLTAIGGKSENDYGGQAIYSFYNDILISGGTVTAKGGQSTNKDGGRAIVAANLGLGNVLITGGNVTATGGNGSINGAHAVYADKGIITVSSGANLTAVGGNGRTGLGGVGVRAVGNDGSVLNGNTVTITNSAGNVYIRGGQGATAQRASIMGKDVYIGTGNIGSAIMEGSNPRSIKNTVGGDGVYLVNVTANPAEAMEIQCTVNGTLGGSYTYRAVADDNGKACVWLPAGAQILSVTGYAGTDLIVAANDTNTVTLSKQSVVTARDSNELKTYMAAPYVTTINLLSGVSYTYDGTTVTRALTINGNGAAINVGTGIVDTIVKRVDNTVTGPVFLAVQGGSLTMRNVTLRNVSTRILAAINVKTGGTLLLDGVNFEGFFANLAADPSPTGPNMDGSHNNFGVHAEPGAVSTTVQNCTFGASNTFRNAVAIRNGTALIQNNTFVGTATPEKQNQTDGFEYAIYLYGGNCTVTGNNISGYDSILKTDLGYHSAAIAICPYDHLVSTITGNNLHDNARGIDGVGAWHTYSHPAAAQINGTTLTASTDAFTIGQALKAANTFAGNADGNIALSLDQNDHYIDVSSGIEYGPPAYFDPFLKAGSTTSTSATLSFDTGTWARAMVRNAKTIGLQVSEDNGATWTAAATTVPLTASSTGATVNLTAGKTYLLRATLQITANTRPVGSLDEVPADITCYSNTVSVTISSGGSGSGRGSGGTSAGQGGTAVIVNGETRTAGTAQTSTAPDGRTTTTVTVDSEKLESILASKERGATVIIPVSGGPDTASGVLTGDMVKGMENRDATLVIKTDSATYTLPAAEINITAISQQLGTNVALKDITVAVSIAASPSQMSRAVEDAAKNGGFIPMIQAVDYTVTCSYGGRTVNVSSFTAYVERTVAIPDGVDPSKITTGIVINPDGTIHHVPTKVTVIDGKYYAVINSLTNSTYSVIWNPIEFSDVNHHWAKASVNNMGSRMVVNGVGSGNYEPNRNMTRAEFAAVMVRALGLEPEKGASGFGDVAATEWYCRYVKTAVAYGIIKGYSDASFGPYDTITREQAMTMIARAMKITGLQAELKDSEISLLLTNYKDGSAASNYAKSSIAACLKTEIVAGRTDNTIAPKNHITRAEAAAIVQRLLQRSDLI